MPRSRVPVRLVSQICVEPQPKGLRAVYLVKTKNEAEAEMLSKVFADFAPSLQTLQLSRGKLVSYAVQLQGEDQSLFSEIETFLRKNFEFVVLHRSFDPLIYDIVKKLSEDSGSSLLPISKCDICGKSDPFPGTLVTFLDNDNVNISTRVYCTSCTAESSGRSSKDFVLSLLEADRGKFGMLNHSEIVRSRSSKKHLAFRIRSDAEHQLAI